MVLAAHRHRSLHLRALPGASRCVRGVSARRGGPHADGSHVAAG